MDRPPIVSLLFFLLAAGIIAAMFNAAREVPARETAAAEAPARETSPPSAPRSSPPLPHARAERIRQFAERWPTNPDYAPAFNALDPAIDIGSAADSRFDPGDDYFGLPRADGYELVFGYCRSCHSLRIVMQQHATRERWEELLDWMVEKQGMAEPPAQDRAALLEYLSVNFGAAQ